MLVHTVSGRAHVTDYLDAGRGLSRRVERTMPVSQLARALLPDEDALAE